MPRGKKNVVSETPQNGPDPETIASYFRKLQDQEDAVAAAKAPYDEERGRHRALVKAAKTDGVDTDALLRTLKAAKRDRNEVEAEERNFLRYSKLMGLPIGTQFDMFGGDVPDQVATDNARHAAKRAGSAAGRRGEHRVDSNPHDPASELYVAFDNGWMDAQRDMVMDLAPQPSESPRLVQGGEMVPA